MGVASGSEAANESPRGWHFGLGVLSGAAMAALVAGAAVLYWFDPSQSRFYPSCLFHQATGLLCPGCGSLRAMHQLLHGNVGSAFRFNALLVLSLPFFAVVMARYALKKSKGQVIPALSAKWIFICVGIAIGFGIWRNLPH